MFYLTHVTIVAISLITIVLSCILFTNAIEFLGNKLKLGNSATGSILAVFGTGLPETIVPIVAFGECLGVIVFPDATEQYLDIFKLIRCHL